MWAGSAGSTFALITLTTLFSRFQLFNSFSGLRQNHEPVSSWGPGLHRFAAHSPTYWEDGHNYYMIYSRLVQSAFYWFVFTLWNITRYLLQKFLGRIASRSVTYY